MSPSLQRMFALLTIRALTVILGILFDVFPSTANTKFGEKTDSIIKDGYKLADLIIEEGREERKVVKNHIH